MNAPKLSNYDEFSQLLENYKASEEAVRLLHNAELVLLVSPTSAGRNAIINKLVESGKYEYLVSDTTRPKRINNGVPESDGVEYNFKTEKEFLEGLKAGQYLEAAIVHEQQVSGISINELQKAADHNKIAIDEIEIIGAQKIHEAKPDSTIIFILPPNFETWMGRLKNRGQMSQDEYLNRIRSAETEIETALSQDYYKFVVNDDLNTAVNDVREIVENQTYSAEQHKHGQDVAWKLLNKIKETLHS